MKFNKTSDKIFNNRPDSKSNKAFDKNKVDKIFDKIINRKPIAKI
jgi:ABC-type transporter MlaC component